MLNCALLFEGIVLETCACVCVCVCACACACVCLSSRSRDKGDQEGDGEHREGHLCAIRSADTPERLPGHSVQVRVRVIKRSFTKILFSEISQPCPECNSVAIEYKHGIVLNEIAYTNLKEQLHLRHHLSSPRQQYQKQPFRKHTAL